MTAWRLAVLALLLLLIGVPLAMPFLDLLGHPEALRVWGESGRLLLLARNTLLLTGGVLALAIPAGVLGAVLLYRTDLPFRGFLRWLTILTLFVPLPLYASAWQAALGTGGWLPAKFWSTPPKDDPDVTATGIPWKPWAIGIRPAIWVHAVAGLPWAIWLIGQGLRWVERELEEDALLLGRPSWVLWRVTLPRSRAAIAVAALWVALQTGTEITVTDMMQVRTFAEEVYTQFVRPERDTGAVHGRDVLARAVAVNLPSVLATGAMILGVVFWWQRSLPPMETRLLPPLQYRLGWSRWPVFLVVCAVVGMLIAVPVGSLVWKAGLTGSPETWSATVAMGYLGQVCRVHYQLVAESLLVAGVTGILAAGLALLTCWLATESSWFRYACVGLIAAAWALPGPIIGIGLLDTIDRLLTLEPQRGPLRALLWDGPSLLPVLWACLIRCYPCAVAILWPVVRLLPRELRDAARVDGAPPRHELLSILLPLTLIPCLRAALAVEVLSLGELSAGKIVETPGSSTFAHQVFNEMHFGVTNQLAALCLLLLLMVLVCGAVVALVARIRSGSNQ